MFYIVLLSPVLSSILLLAEKIGVSDVFAGGLFKSVERNLHSDTSVSDFSASTTYIKLKIAIKIINFILSGYYFLTLILTLMLTL